MDELWRDMGRTDAPPAADVRAVKARVNAALDADPEERRSYMKQKFRMALVVAAAVAAITGSALAVSANLDVLQAFFQGDTSPAQEYMDSTVRSVSDENYTLTVESSVADESTAYLVMTVKALNEESRQFLFSDEFIGMDTFHMGTLNADGTKADHGISGFGTGEIREARTENSISWHADADLTGPAANLRIWLDYMAEDKAVEVSLSPAPSVTVKIGASGIGLWDFDTTVSETITVERVTLTPFTCKIECSGNRTNPRVFFRVADGALCTQSQMMTSTSWGNGAHNYRFKVVQDLSQIRSVIVFDREYPMDGSVSTPVAHDPALDPFQVPQMAPLTEDGGYSIPVRALTETLGGTCDWDAATGVVKCVYRGVTVILTPGSDAATVDGQSVTMWETPAVQDGTLAANYQVFFDAWGLDGFVLRTEVGDEVVCGDWYVIP